MILSALFKGKMKAIFCNATFLDLDQINSLEPSCNLVTVDGQRLIELGG
jgi:hypothetical protein